MSQGKGVVKDGLGSIFLSQALKRLANISWQMLVVVVKIVMAVKTGNKKVNVGSFKKLIEPGSSLDIG